MPIVICKLKHAAAEINGVKFKETENGMVSEEVSAEVAEYFGAIPGYEVVAGQGSKAAKKAEDKKAEDKKADESESKD